MQGRRRVMGELPPVAELKAYQPTLAERAGQWFGDALGSRSIGRSATKFLSEMTPVGNIDDILSGDKNRQQLAALPLPGPARKAAGAAVDWAERQFKNNRIFDSMPGPNIRFKDSPVAEPGYAYRVMNEAELLDAQKLGVFVPAPPVNGKVKYGGEKQWVNGAANPSFGPGKAVVRVPLAKVRPDAPVSFADIEIVRRK